MKITFIGATQTVTGSKFLLTIEGKKILVDCGLFQGLKELRLRNWDKLPIDPEEIAAVILTHAHIDHSGYLPLLVRNGFKGKIFCSPATFDLCKLLLPDSGYLQEEEAKLANMFGYSKHHPALPLYTQVDAEISLQQFQVIDFGTEYNLANVGSFTLHHAGHILGASSIMIKADNTKILFTGDLGRPHDPVMRPPATIQAADYLVLESTYGNRSHDKSDPKKQIAEIINRTIKRGGSIIVPAFAVGRAQELLYYLYLLKKENSIVDIPVFLDSPMAIDATEIFYRYHNEHRLSKQECIDICKNVTYVNSIEQSHEIDNYNSPIIIISASGMATGGRILHHLKAFLPDYRNTILFTGYQAVGTRGDRLIRKESEIKIHGEMIPVRAEIQILHNLSAHADADEIMQWLRNFNKPPREVFLVHGESDSALALKSRIEDQLQWRCNIPEYMQTENL